MKTKIVEKVKRKLNERCDDAFWSYSGNFSNVSHWSPLYLFFILAIEISPVPVLLPGNTFTLHFCLLFFLLTNPRVSFFFESCCSNWYKYHGPWHGSGKCQSAFQPHWCDLYSFCSMSSSLLCLNTLLIEL